MMLNSSNIHRRTTATMIPAFREPIHILGSGSIGLLFASSIRFKFPAFPVTLLVRDRHRHHFDKQTRMPPPSTSVSDRFTSPASSTSKITSEAGSFSSYPNTKILRERFRHDDEVFAPHFVHHPHQQSHQHQQLPYDRKDDTEYSERLIDHRPVMKISWEQHIDPSSIVHGQRKRNTLSQRTLQQQQQQGYLEVCWETSGRTLW